MTDAEIDVAILARLDGRWQKVAMVVGLVGKSISASNGEDEYDRVARRIYSLVRAGRVAAVGDIERWRESEIRLPRG